MIQCNVCQRRCPDDGSLLLELEPAHYLESNELADKLTVNGNDSLRLSCWYCRRRGCLALATPIVVSCAMTSGHQRVRPVKQVWLLS